MDNTARIATFLAQGLSISQTASIVGCTPAYISQLKKEAETNPDSRFALLVAEAVPKVQEDLTEDKILTNKYMSIEHKILSAIENQVGFAELPALTRALEVVANRQEKRATRLATPAGTGHVVQNIIQISVPSHAIPEYQINGNKEVVQIGSSQLAPLSSDGVKNLFAQIQASRHAETVQAVTEF